MPSTLAQHPLLPVEEHRASGGRPALSDPPLVEGSRVGEFIVERKIGEGAMATVYSAIHSVIYKRAAIKVMSRALGCDEIFYERFLLEARSVNHIRHPNIVDVFGFGRLDDGRCYLMMELLEGETLGDRLLRGALPLAEAIAILDQASDGLEATHEQGIVHRDLKPENLFLVAGREGSPCVKLLDFGIAKLLDADAPLLRSYAGEYIGTPSYNSPEQARGEEVDHLTDVYSLGVLAFEMVTGRRPFEAPSVIEVQTMHLTTPPPSACALDARLPKALDLLLGRMMAKDPAARPQLMEVRASLAALTLLPPPKVPRRSWIAVTAISAALGAALFALAGWHRAAPAASTLAATVLVAPAAVSLVAPLDKTPEPTPAPATEEPTRARIAKKRHDHPRVAAPRPHSLLLPGAARAYDYLLDASGRQR